MHRETQKKLDSHKGKTTNVGVKAQGPMLSSSSPLSLMDFLTLDTLCLGEKVRGVPNPQDTHQQDERIQGKRAPNLILERGIWILMMVRGLTSTERGHVGRSGKNTYLDYESSAQKSKKKVRENEGLHNERFGASGSSMA